MLDINSLQAASVLMEFQRSPSRQETCEAYV